MTLARLFQAIFGPSVYRIYSTGPYGRGRPYNPNVAEDYSGKVLLFGYFAFHVLAHVFPLYATYYVIRRGYPSFSGIFDTMMGYSFIPLILSCAYIIRGCGRYANPDYQTFLDLYDRSKSVTGKFGHEQAVSTGLASVDFDFSHYPVCFTHDETPIRPRVLSSERPLAFSERILRFPFSVLNYLGAHVVGRRLVYPGSISLIQMALNVPLCEGRERLLKEYKGQRAKLVTVDGNHIDTMFVDRRNQSSNPSHRGDKLVIACEGNAAFYEVLGAMGPPLESGYSVLGWNHPGFAGSSGLPFPSEEANAIDVVVRYAVSQLDFQFSDIIIYAWSIGGFTASWAAMSYPQISAVILDATFDELQPLAVRQVPDWLKSLTKDMIKEYFELNIAEQISHYPGPVHLIRRVQDEMITTRPNDPTSNRINSLLVKILQYRYPMLFTSESTQALWQWVFSFTSGDKDGLLMDKRVDTNWCNITLVSHVSGHGSSYPSMIGETFTAQQKTQMLLYLAGKYMEDFRTTHCTPLQLSYFKIPLQGNIGYRT